MQDSYSQVVLNFIGVLFGGLPYFLDRNFLGQEVTPNQLVSATEDLHFLVLLIQLQSVLLCALPN